MDDEHPDDRSRGLATLRLQFAAVVLGFAVLGALSGWLGIATLAGALRRSAAHVPLVEFRPFYVTGLPLAAAFLALMVLALLPKEPARRPHGRRTRIRPTHVAFGVVVCSLLLAVVTTLLATISMTNVMRHRGYSACPATDTERRPPMRWIRDDGRCP